MNGLPPLLKKLQIEHVWCVAVLVGIFSFLNTQPVRPNDFWWQLAAGKELSLTHQIPAADTHSFTAAGQPYAAYKMFWLVDLGYYGLYQAGGLALIVFSHSLIITLAYLLLLLLCRQITRNWRVAAFCTLFAAVLGISDWNVRPQALSFLIGALFLAGIYASQQKKQIRWLLVFPAGMLVWVNSHGSFIIGLALLGIWVLDELIKGFRASRKAGIGPVLKPAVYPLVAFGSSLLAIGVNPAGLGIANYVLGMMKSSVIQTLVPEWAAPSINTFEGGIFWGGFILCAVIFLFSFRQVTLFQGVVFVVFGGLAIKTSRGIIWFGIMMAPVLADWVIRQWNTRKWTVDRLPKASRAGLNAVFILAFALMAVISLPWFKGFLPLPELKTGLISSETPVAGTHYLLAHHLPGPLFNDLAFGSYLIWANQAPDGQADAQPAAYKVFVDPRLELYPWGVWQDYLAIGQGQANWEQCLDQYGIKTLFLDPAEETGLVRLAQKSKNWSLVYQDAHSVIFTKE